MKTICRKICKILIDNEVVATYFYDLCYEEADKTTQKTYLTFKDLFLECDGYTMVPYKRFLFWADRVRIGGNSIDSDEITIMEKNFRPVTKKYSFRQVSSDFPIYDLAKRLKSQDFLEWLKDNKLFYEKSLTS